MLSLILALIALCFASRSQVHGSPLSGVRNAPFATKIAAGQDQSEPIPPTEDPFYTVPQGYQRAHPGDILRIREAPGNITALLGANCSAAYNILYRTQNSRYEADWAITTVFVPATPAAGATGNGSALLSYQIPYDSTFLDASPSYALYGSDAASSRGDISTGLSYGWFVNVPDYEGPLASFTAGVQSGHATIDSVRAVMQAAGAGGDISDYYDGYLNHDYYGNEASWHHTGSQNNISFALWGYSGGALASEWAAELQVQYAPELTDSFKGAALGGLTPNVTSVLLSVNGNVEAGLVPPSILGLISQYPDEGELLLSRLKTEGPYNATGFLAVLNYTLDEAIVAYAFQNIGDYFVGGLADLLGPVPTKLSQLDGVMGYHGVPQVPLYVYKAIADEVSAVNDTDALVERFCGSKSQSTPERKKEKKQRGQGTVLLTCLVLVGVNILYDRNTVGGHSAESTNGKPAALAFLDSILRGTNATGLPAAGCAINTVTVNITDSPLRRRGIPGGLLEYMDE